MQKQHWDFAAVERLYDLPLMELLFTAQTIHREHFNPNEVELCTLLSVKTGRCPEDCAYCPQSAHYQTFVEKDEILDVEEVTARAMIAKKNGATRFCMGAAWRNPPEKQFKKFLHLVTAVKELGLETCVTLGMLSKEQTQQLKESGLDYYNHNLDTSPEFYKTIITTRTYADRLETLENVRNAGINVCCGGIVGMGETRKDRIELLVQLANLTEPPESVPINRLIPIPGTPLAKEKPLDNTEFVRTVATARIMMPRSRVRLSAGRFSMTEEMQALCFLAGANSIHFGEVLLTTPNATADQDMQMLAKFGMTPRKLSAAAC